MGLQIYCGTDIIEISRIKHSLDTVGDRFRDRVYTDREIEYCEGKRAAKYQSYAARFAGKEAVSKAMGTGFSNGLFLKDIEIINDAAGKPCVELSDRAKAALVHIGDFEIALSLSHCQEYAVACVVIYANK